MKHTQKETYYINNEIEHYNGKWHMHIPEMKNKTSTIKSKSKWILNTKMKSTNKIHKMKHEKDRNIQHKY